MSVASVEERGHARPYLVGLHKDEIEIHLRIDTLADAIRNKNLDRVMAHYAPDVSVYGLLPPLDLHGSDAYRKNMEKWFESMASRICYELLDVQVSASDTHAFCHCLVHVQGARTGGGRSDFWVRITRGWRKVEGEWLVQHEHISAPTMM
jgi:ketosteroid isomerase-like protein